MFEGRCLRMDCVCLCKRDSVFRLFVIGFYVFIVGIYWVIVLVIILVKYNLFKNRFVCFRGVRFRGNFLDLSFWVELES